MATQPTPLDATIAAQGRRKNWVAAQLDPPVTLTTVSKWCSGERPIPPKRVIELANLLGVSPARIARTEAVEAS